MNAQHTPRATGQTATRRIVNARAAGRCERCGQPGPTTIHHRQKRSRGGRWAPSNCVALCGDGVRGCHGWTETDPAEATAAGWLVPSWRDPGEAPLIVATFSFCFVWLDDTGGYRMDGPGDCQLDAGPQL